MTTKLTKAQLKDLLDVLKEFCAAQLAAIKKRDSANVASAELRKADDAANVALARLAVFGRVDEQTRDRFLFIPLPNLQDVLLHFSWRDGRTSVRNLPVEVYSPQEHQS